MFLSTIYTLLILSLSIFVVPLSKKWIAATVIASAGAVVALIEAVGVILTGQSDLIVSSSNVIFGTQYTSVDTLSALFLVMVSLMAVAVLIYAKGYLQPYYTQKSCFQIGLHYFSLVAMFLSMLLVVTAGDAFSFLFAWELMTITSGLLILFDGERSEVRRAALNYLILMHIGFVFLLVGFTVLHLSQVGEVALPAGFDLLRYYFSGVGYHSVGGVVLFVIFLIGFGMKAGMFPLHVWLPEAHPAAPSHVSGLMSGVMIKMGVYGILRLIGALTPDYYYTIGLLLLIVGVVTGLWGVIFATLQNDIKKILAYSSIENIGVILIGLGVGLLGRSQGNNLIAVLGFTGALLHVINHACFKTLLFLGAGNVYCALHTTSLDVLGGLARRMPLTARLILVGCVAICALPPLSGFVSEFMIYMGMIEGLSTANGLTLECILGLLSLALIGGMVVLAFTKLYGVAFLGNARSEVVSHAQEAGNYRLVAMVIPLAGILMVGLFPAFVVPAVVEVVGDWLRLGLDPLLLSGMSAKLMSFNIALWVLILFVGVIYGVRRWTLRGKTEAVSPTWGCAFTAPTPRMQYTGESFSEGLENITGAMMRNSGERVKLDREEIFPTSHHFEVQHKDRLDSVFTRWWILLLKETNARATRLRTGRITDYVLYALLFFVLIFVMSLFNLLG